MLTIILIITILLVLLGPQFWTRHILNKYSDDVDHFPGNGAELARHILDGFALTNVKVEQTERGDHYDPMSECVRLEQRHYEKKSLAAIAVAAHEVGHAIQHATSYQPLQLRTKLAIYAAWIEKAAVVLIMLVPVVTLLTRSPVGGAFSFLLAATFFLLPILVHLVTLPVEFDASFGRAMPVLRSMGKFTEAELTAMRSILRVCALTYVSGSLSSLLNFWRWMAILRR